MLSQIVHVAELASHDAVTATQVIYSAFLAAKRFTVRQNMGSFIDVKSGVILVVLFYCALLCIKIGLCCK
jgi:hypothetical protein